jgi:flagellar biogenesis protein FliO
VTAIYLVVGLAALGVFGLGAVRRYWPQGAQQSDAIRLVTSKYLGGKRFLTLVEVDGERLLLGLAGEQVSLVARLGAGYTATTGERA